MNGRDGRVRERKEEPWFIRLENGQMKNGEVRSKTRGFMVGPKGDVTKPLVCVRDKNEEDGVWC